jgi:hypothetical protein
MRRTLGALSIIAVLLLAPGAVAACGGDGDGGLGVLDDGTASSGASPVASTSATPDESAEPTPVMSGEGEDPFGGDDTAATPEEVAAYLTEVQPIFKEATRIEKIAGAMLVEVSQVADDSWDVAADRTEEYATQIEMQESQWLDVTPPNGLQEVHQIQAGALATEVEMLDLLASQLRARTWNVVKGTKDVNRLSEAARQQREEYRAELEAVTTELGVPVPWKWPAW